MDFDPDVGVLIVHGIGTQKEGSELRQWVDSVLGYLDAFPAAADGPDARILQAGPEDKLVRLHTPPLGGTTAHHRQRWLIGEAWWADAFDVPDRAEVSKWLVGVSSWFLYLFVVRLWRRFHVDPVHILTGLFVAGSVFMIFRQAADHGIGAEFWVAAAVALVVVVVTTVRKGRRLGGLVVGATLLIGYPLAALVTAGALLLWLVGLLPGKISEKARATQLGLAQSVGDVYALIASRRREQAMFDAITAEAKRLADAKGMEGKPLVLLAHSQGAALTYRALNTDSGLAGVLAGRKVTLITYGAAIVPVHLLEQRLSGRRPGLQRLQAAGGFVGLLLFAFSLVRLAADGVDTVTRWATNISIPLVFAAFVGTWFQERKARGEDTAVTVSSSHDARAGDAKGSVTIGLRSPQGCQLRWVDLWAPWDPVPNGPLSVANPCSPKPCGPESLDPPSGTDEFISCRAANVHQPWRDHVVYRANYEDVVSRWVGEIATRAKPAVVPGDVERPGKAAGSAKAARTWRLERGRDLFVGQVFALILGFLAIAKHWDELDDLGRQVARRVPLRSALSSLGDLVPAGARDVVFGQHRDASHLHGLLVALALLLAAILVASKVMSSWQAAATSAFLSVKDGADPRAQGWLPAAIAAAVAMACFIVWGFAFHIDLSPTRPVQVQPAVLVEASKATGPSPKTTVRFEPVGTGDATPVVASPGKKPTTVVLDDAVTYRITATATGGKDCTVSAVPAARPDTVTVSCTAAGALLPRGR